jgi:3-deoxy-D-manno-octulosonic-acid transferase
MPVDREPYIEKFLDYWRPDFMLLIESELWPNMLSALRKRHVPAALINGRMSNDSFHRWYRFKGWAKEIMGTFSLCLTQTEDDRGRFVALGAKPVRCLGNLKYAAKPLPVDQSELVRLHGEIGTRPMWLMASSHRGEEKLALDIHEKLRKKMPDLLTIIVPRHAVRGAEIAKLIEERGFAGAQRSKKEPIEKETEIYLADTMGELGLFYRLSPLVALGGSFIPVGGHNPIEPAQLDCAIILGPYMNNFSTIAREFVQKNAAIKLKNAAELAATVERLLHNFGERISYANAARELAEQKRHVLDEVLEALTPQLDMVAKKAA